MKSIRSRKELLKSSRLYAIIDKKTAGRRKLFNIALKTKDAGADIVQLRDKISPKAGILKEAQKIRFLLSGSKTLFIINDHPDIAIIAESDGLHLGQGDISVPCARRLLGRERIIGISCHNLDQAIKAESEGADYISIGPIFSTPTKPEYKAVGLDLIKKISRAIKIPFFVIGGISEENINKVLSLGAKRIAVCRPVCRAHDVFFSSHKLSQRLIN